RSGHTIFPFVGWAGRCVKETFASPRGGGPGGGGGARLRAKGGGEVGGWLWWRRARGDEGLVVWKGGERGPPHPPPAITADIHG
ncbi:hypothetical protein CWI49_04570, partial [Neisseria meningitidis]